VTFENDDLSALGEVIPPAGRQYRNGSIAGPVALPAVLGSVECIRGELGAVVAPPVADPINGFNRNCPFQ
jgi:hypothetical protein